MKKQTFLKQSIYSIFLATLFFGTVSPIRAADGTVKLVVAANLNIYDAKIIKQDGHALTLGFALVNGTGVQPQIKYGVEVFRETPSGNILVADQPYDEILSLSENTRRYKQINYSLPDALGGTYAIYITSKNESGSPLAFAYAGKVTVAENKKLKQVTIDKENCFLKVDQERINKKYTISQGVDIRPTESLTATCRVSNTTDQDMKFIPTYVTHYRTLYGEVVGHIGGDTKEVILKKGEVRDLSFSLPKATVPQAYDIKFSLVNPIFTTNSVVFHYVLRGVSATIQNISLDKDEYSKGDGANIAVFWSGSADSFTDSRLGTGSTPSSMIMEITITNKDGVSCIQEPLTKSLSSKDSVKAEFTAKITRDCVNPNVLASFKSTEGTIITPARSFAVETLPKENGLPEITKIAIATAALLVLLGGASAAYYIRKTKSTSQTTI